MEDELAGDLPPGAEHYVHIGFYSEPLERYLRAFGDNVYVLFLEAMTRDPSSELREVFEFLGVEAEVAERLTAEHRNRLRCRAPGPRG